MNITVNTTAGERLGGWLYRLGILAGKVMARLIMTVSLLAVCVWVFKDSLPRDVYVLVDGKFELVYSLHEVKPK